MLNCRNVVKKTRWKYDQFNSSTLISEKGLDTSLEQYINHRLVIYTVDCIDGQFENVA